MVYGERRFSVSSYANRQGVSGIHSAVTVWHLIDDDGNVDIVDAPCESAESLRESQRYRVPNASALAKRGTFISSLWGVGAKYGKPSSFRRMGETPIASTHPIGGMKTLGCTGMVEDLEAVGWEKGGCFARWGLCLSSVVSHYPMGNTQKKRTVGSALFLCGLFLVIRISRKQQTCVCSPANRRTSVRGKFPTIGRLFRTHSRTCSRYGTTGIRRPASQPADSIRSHC